MHIYGPSFVRECLPPSHKDFGKFAIPREVVRCSELEAQGWKASPNIGTEHGEIPRSVPHEAAVEKKDLRPKAAKGFFREGSPFDSDDQSSPEVLHGYRIATPGLDFAESLSPKSSFHGSGWTSINPPNTPVSHFTASPTTPLTNSLLTQPRFASWRPQDPAGDISRSVKMPTGAHDKHRVHKRRRSTFTFLDDEYDSAAEKGEEDLTSFADVSDSESDDEDIPLPRKKALKPPRYHPNADAADGEGRGDSSATKSPPPMKKVSVEKKRAPKSRKFNAGDVRAAKLLLGLHFKDKDLAMGPDGIVRGPGAMQ